LVGFTERYFSAGEPTKLVRTGGSEFYERVEELCALSRAVHGKGNTERSRQPP